MTYIYIVSYTIITTIHISFPIERSLPSPSPRPQMVELPRPDFADPHCAEAMALQSPWGRGRQRLWFFFGTVRLLLQVVVIILYSVVIDCCYTIFLLLSIVVNYRLLLLFGPKWTNSSVDEMCRKRDTQPLQDGAPKIAKLVYKWLNYGLWQIELQILTMVNGVYKPTYNWGAPSCTLWLFNIAMENCPLIDDFPS